MSGRPRRTGPRVSTHPGASPAPSEAAAVIAICFGWFILGSIEAVAKGFPPGGSFDDGALADLVFFEIGAGAMALWVLRARGYSLAALLPAPNWQGCLVGTALCGAGLLVWQLVGSAFPVADLARQPISEMAGRTGVSLPVVVAMGMVNGLYEETFLVGYLVRGFRVKGAAFAIGLSLLVRVLYHLYQGPIGALSVLVFGLVLSLFYWRTRWLWPVVFAHALADTWALF